MNPTLSPLSPDPLDAEVEEERSGFPLADLLVGLGLVCMGVGVGWWVHPGAGLTLGGACLFGLGLWGALRWEGR